VAGPLSTTRAPLTVLLTLAMTVSTGCTRHVLREADPAHGVELPADHAAHGDAQTEWWHFHGHVVDDAGRRYDWFLAFIKQHTDLDRVWFLPVRWFVDPFYAAYFTVTDRARGELHVREKHSFPDTWTAGARTDVLGLRHDNWSATTRREVFELRASTLRTRIELQLRPIKAAARIGQRGYLHVPPRSSHYYYSIPRLAAQGTLTVDGQRRAVRGLGWLKHEWGFLYTDHLDGWTWFGVQLSSGHDLEIGLVFDRRWNLARGSFAVVEEPDGRVTQLDVRTVGVSQSGEIWRSPRTNQVYPTGWVLELPGRGTLTLRAAVDAQEMIVFPANMWAGGLHVVGLFDGQRVTGDCFGEVVGLDQPFGRSLFRSGHPSR
jgi:predicted secreted hydrolase